ncbi:MAG: hypothetical protein E7593_02305 [Ruminococcaceae bacterium]|nr:hypothetical protein [Oscillospiraceae bacterium]
MKKSAKILYIALVAFITLIVATFVVVAVVGNMRNTATTQIVCENVNIGGFKVDETFEVPFKFEQNNIDIECGMITLTWNKDEKVEFCSISINPDLEYLVDMSDVCEYDKDNGKLVIKWMGTSISSDLTEGDLFSVGFIITDEVEADFDIDVEVNNIGYVTNTDDGYDSMDYSESVACTESINIYKADRLYEYSLSLDSSMVLNYYVYFTEETEAQIEAGNVDFKFEIEGDRRNRGNIEVTSEHKVTKEDDRYYGMYKFAVPLYATEMTVPVTGYAIINGEKCDETEYTTTIREYADIVLEMSPKYADIINSMLNYGGKSQVYFGTNINDLADKGINFVGSDKEIADKHLEKFTKASKTGEVNVQGVTYKYSTIVLFNEIVIRHYFDIEDTSIISADDMAKLTLKSGKTYYYETEGIMPNEYADQKPVEIFGLTIKYSVMNYANGIKNYSGASTAEENNKVQAVAYALYEYYKATSGYVENFIPEMPDMEIGM